MRARGASDLNKTTNTRRPAKARWRRVTGYNRRLRSAIVRQVSGLNEGLCGSVIRCEQRRRRMSSGRHRVSLDLKGYLAWGLILSLVPALGILWLIDKIFPKHADPRTQLTQPAI